MSGRQRDNPFPLGRQERADAYVQRASPTLDEGCTSCTTLLMCESCLRATSSGQPFNQDRLGPTPSCGRPWAEPAVAVVAAGRRILRAASASSAGHCNRPGVRQSRSGVDRQAPGNWPLAGPAQRASSTPLTAWPPQDSGRVLLGAFRFCWPFAAPRPSVRIGRPSGYSLYSSSPDGVATSREDHRSPRSGVRNKPSKLPSLSYIAPSRPSSAVTGLKPAILDEVDRIGQ